jgi:hypothetical protein
MLEHLTSPTKALVGPWAHKYPHFALPGPQIGFLQECLRFWDKWLKGVETGVMDEPALRAYIQDPVGPATSYGERPGRWVAEESWPSQRISAETWTLAPGRLAGPGETPAEAALSIRSPQTVGLHAGKWCAYGIEAADLPGDQREEAGGSLVFDSEPLTEPLEILGAPVLNLVVASDKANAFVAATLSEVLPDGSATRVSYGILNLTHRNGHEDLRPLESGRRYDVRVQLNECGQRFGVGSRVRLALSTSYWPIVWPSPEAATLTVFAGASALDLPVRPPRAEDVDLPDFEPAEGAPPLRRTVLKPGSRKMEVTRDLETGRVTVERFQDDGLSRIVDFDWETRTAARRFYTIDPADPLSAESRIHWHKEYGRGDFRTSLDARTHMRVTKTEFLIGGALDAYEGEDRVFSKEWNCRIPRDHV